MDLVPSGMWHCVVCQREVECDLDDRVEVSFSAELGVRDLQLEVYKNAENYSRYYFTQNLIRSPELTAFVYSLSMDLRTVQADADDLITIEAKPGMTYRMLSLDNHSQVMFPPAGDGPGAGKIEVSSTTDGMSPSLVAIQAGPVTVRMVNRSASPMGYMVMRVDREGVMNLAIKHPNQFRPFLTARTLLNSQTFRDLFRVQTLDVNMRLRLRSLTLVFTDLKGSTELYDRTGDIRAYTLVREHFKVLAEAVKRHNGAMIKTMGDAIMASFD